MSRTVFALALFVALLGSFIGWTAYAAEDQQFYYMGRWEWYQEVDAKAQPTGFDYWRCPGGDCAGLIDLRSIPQTSLSGGKPEGYGFFIYEEPQLSPSLYYIGNSLNYPLKVDQKQWIEENLGLVQGIAQSTVLDVLYTDLLILNGDPTGQDRWKPLRGSLKTGIKLYLTNELVKREEFNQDHIAFQGTIEVFRADYARLKSEGMPVEHLREVTGAKMQSLFGRMGDDLLEPLLGSNVSDGWEKPRTTHTDNFNTGDSVNVGAQLSWSDMSGDMQNVSNEAKAIGGAAYARADSDLSSDDHYALADVTHYASSGNVAGPIVRYSSSADTGYLFFVKSAATNTYRIFKRVDGSNSQVGGSVNATYPPPTFEAKLIVDASALTGYIDSVLKIGPISDPNITGNLRGGLVMSENCTQDNFEAADLAAGAIVTNSYWY